MCCRFVLSGIEAKVDRPVSHEQRKIHTWPEVKTPSWRRVVLWGAEGVVYIEINPTH
jgi:hypothetical protein